MVTEDYVSFEIAKLLREKRFDWEWSPFYSEQDRDEWFLNNNYNISNPNYDESVPFDSEVSNVIAPHVSLQMAMKWLREVHKIFIEVGYNRFYGTYNVHVFNMVEQQDDPYKLPARFNNYEEACDTAIKYCLENLI